MAATWSAHGVRRFSALQRPFPHLAPRQGRRQLFDLSKRQSGFTILRLYGALEPWFDKTWRPGEIELTASGAK